MEKKSSKPTAQKKNTPAKEHAGEPSTNLQAKPPAKPQIVDPPTDVAAALPTQHITPTQTTRQPDPVPVIPRATPTDAAKSTHEPNEEEVMEEFIRKFGSEEKAIAFFARVSAKREKKEPAPTPLKTPPQSSTTQETHITQASTFHTENPQTATDVPAPNRPHAEESAVPDKNMDKSEAVEEGEGVEGDALVEGMQRMEV